MADGGCSKPALLSWPSRVWGDGHRSVEVRIDRGKELLMHVTPRLLLYLVRPRAPLGISDLVWLTSPTMPGLYRGCPELSHGVFPLFAFYQSSGYSATSRKPWG